MEQDERKKRFYEEKAKYEASLKGSENSTVPGLYERQFPVQDLSGGKNVETLSVVDHSPRFAPFKPSEEVQKTSSPEGYFPISNRPVPQEVRNAQQVDGYLS